MCVHGRSNAGTVCTEKLYSLCPRRFKTSGQGPGQPAVDGSALNWELGWIICRGPFLPHCSVILLPGTPNENCFERIVVLADLSSPFQPHVSVIPSKSRFYCIPETKSHHPTADTASVPDLILSSMLLFSHSVKNINWTSSRLFSLLGEEENTVSLSQKTQSYHVSFI